jgi:hypothetical protein
MVWQSEQDILGGLLARYGRAIDLAFLERYARPVERLLSVSRGFLVMMRASGGCTPSPTSPYGGFVILEAVAGSTTVSGHLQLFKIILQPV